MKDLKERKKLMEETPPEEVKYWFEYTGSLQVCLSSRLYIFFDRKPLLDVKILMRVKRSRKTLSREMRITPIKA